MTQPISIDSDQARKTQIDAMDDRAQLDQLVKQLLIADPDRIVVAHIGHITEDAPDPPREAQFYHLRDPTTPSGRRDFNIRSPDACTPGRRPVLVVYTWAGFLALWDRMEEDVDGFLHGRQQVVIVFLQEKFARLSFKNHSYVLSALLSALPRRKFVSCLTVYTSSQGNADAPLDHGSSDESSEYDAQRFFSALVVSVTPRHSAPSIETSLGMKSWLIRAAEASWRLVSRIGARRSGTAT